MFLQESNHGWKRVLVSFFSPWRAIPLHIHANELISLNTIAYADALGSIDISNSVNF